MFDAHNHYTDKDSILKTGNLLPQNYKNQQIENEIESSEIGLDKRYIDKINKEEQLKLFEKCIQYAKENCIPFHIHCVGFTNEMIVLLKKYKPYPFTVVWHRFNGSYEIARELYKLGVIISISNDYIKDISILYKNNPDLVLETDYEGNNEDEHNFLILKNYTRTAKALNISVDQLEENCKNIYFRKIKKPEN